MQFRRFFRRPRIGFEIRPDNFFARGTQEIEKRRDVQRVMTRTERSEIFFRQFEQSHRRAQTPAMFGVGGMFEILLKMNERARGLNHSLKKIVVRGVGIQPEVFQHVVGFVVALVVPASKISPIKRMARDLAGKIGVVTFEVANELRNSFAFVHEAFNFTMPQMMGKPTFPEGPDSSRRRCQE